MALLPLLRPNVISETNLNTRPQWPTHLDGRRLHTLGLTEQERGFVRGFPGHVARFTDGSREIVMRWLSRPSRRLHPASDCFKGVGYTITPKPIRQDGNGQHWGCFVARRGNRRLRVCERIYDEQGRSWSDVSAWYWAAVLGKTSGPWWTVTVAEKSWSLHS